MPTELELRQRVVAQMTAWKGAVKGDARHHLIVDTYNSIQLLPRNHRLTYSENYCAGTVSAAFQEAQLTEIMVPECSCSTMVSGAKERGLWDGNKNRVPIPGDIILYDWGANLKDRYHTGLVTAVNGKTITVTEGNRTVSGKSQVADRTIPVGWAYIWGYIVPDYKSKEETDMKKEEIKAMIDEAVQKAKDELAGQVYTSEEDSPDWARPAIRWAVEQKVLTGDENGRLHLTLDNLTNLQMLYKLQTVPNLGTGKEGE